jgi:hypothetical protein
LLGVAVALVRGGSLAGWTGIRVLWWPAAVGALALLLVLHNPPVDHQPWAIQFGPWIWTGCLALLAAMLLRNGFASHRYRGAFMLAAAGVALNLFVVAANGGYMPQSEAARIAARGAAIPTTGESQLRNVQPLDTSTNLAALGDVIAEPRWFPGANVISLGDLVLGFGLAWWAFRVTTSERRPT